MVGQKYFKGGGCKHTFSGNYTQYNKINNTENFRGSRLLLEGGESPLAPLSCGPVQAPDQD